ncbi:Uma2 family endonuclease [Streptomyces polyrhachis]|uniref:Uma2 family endonuclease n=1 Tax=Streptomyces polyrhachis TaxID=1282885 RepID=A0ABW2GQ26_9ACTN
MTAEALPAEHTIQWPVPPEQGYTVDDLFTLPGLPPHTELIDGSLVFVSPQRVFHSLVMYLLEAGLRRTAPPEVRVRREMTVVIDKRQGPEPDLLVVSAEAEADTGQTHYRAEDVSLAVEVVSPDSEARDRLRKPQLYAKGGIEHFWRVEQGEDGLPVAYVYERDPATGEYALTGIHRNRLKLAVPFPVDIDLTELERL